MFLQTLTRFFKFSVPLLLIGYAIALFSVFPAISFSDPVQKIFLLSLVGSIVASVIFVKAHGYLAVLLHELTHNLWGVITFNKPVALQVEANRGGQFVFQGAHNIMSVLSPYFFPIITFVVFPFYFLLASSGAAVYFGILGATYGLSLSTGIRQAHPHQPDLQVYGKGWSYMIVALFIMLIMGFLLSFTIGRMPMATGFLKQGIHNLFDLYLVIKEIVISLINKG